MTINFDKLVKIFLEEITIQRKGLLPAEWEYYPNISEDDLKNGIFLHDWDLKDFQQFKKLLKIADRKNLYIFGQAYPYNTNDRMNERNATPEEKQAEFEKDQKRLISMYSKFGFVHTSDGYIYRPPISIQKEMTDSSVFGADGPYPTDDPRTPFLMGTYSRKGKVKKKKRRKRKKTIKESIEDSIVPTVPGTYELIRGSRNGNENSAYGIYANGIHYTTDYTTALEFGEPSFFKVNLKNPIVLSVSEIYKIGNPSKVTKILLQKGYDSLVIPHEKEWDYIQDGEERSEKYTEYEVILLKNEIS
jgi:hypothetical protein